MLCLAHVLLQSLIELSFSISISGGPRGPQSTFLPFLLLLPYLSRHIQRLTNLSIYNSHALASQATPLIVYLPPSGSHLRPQHAAIPHYLLSDGERDYPLARINYRWNHVPPPPKPLSQSLDEPPPPPVCIVQKAEL